MKRVIKSIVSICIAISLVPSTAFAGGQTQRCRQAGEQAQKQCLEKNAANNAIDQTTGAARAASSQPGINDNSVTDLAQNQEQQARVKDTIATCEAAQKKCEQECQSAAQTAGADDNQMMPHNPDGEYRSQVDGEKQNTCVAPLMAAKGDGMAALAALAAAAAAMMAAKSASDKGKEEENKEDRKPACEGSDGAKYAHCTDQYVSTCTSNMSAPGCDVFAARYCGASSATTPTNDTPLQTGNDNVIGTFSSGTPATGDQFRMTAAGEGANSEFCRLYIAGKLCTFTENGKCKDPKTGFDPANPNDATGTAGVSTGTPSTSLTTGLTENDSSASNADRFSAGNTGAAGSGSGGGLGGGTDSMAPASVGGG
jgi:hypothetical protein